MVRLGLERPFKSDFLSVGLQRALFLGEIKQIQDLGGLIEDIVGTILPTTEVN